MFAKKAPRGRAKKKKLVIKGFAEDLSVRPVDFEEQAWVKLRSAIVAVQTSTAVDISREELYAVRRAASCADTKYLSATALPFRSSRGNCTGRC